MQKHKVNILKNHIMIQELIIWYLLVYLISVMAHGVLVFKKQYIVQQFNMV